MSDVIPGMSTLPDTFRERAISCINVGVWSAYIPHKARTELDAAERATYGIYTDLSNRTYIGAYLTHVRSEQHATCVMLTQIIRMAQSWDPNAPNFTDFGVADAVAYQQLLAGYHIGYHMPRDWQHLSPYRRPPFQNDWSLRAALGVVAFVIVRCRVNIHQFSDEARKDIVESLREIIRICFNEAEDDTPDAPSAEPYKGYSLKEVLDHAFDDDGIRHVAIAITELNGCEHDDLVVWGDNPKLRRMWEFYADEARYILGDAKTS